MDPQPTSSAAGAPPGLAYHGRLGETWSLAIRITLLTILTLGVYRFWAKTRLRRYFWSRVTVDGEPLEYTGTGLELFLGFLIVLAILTPLYGAVGFVPLFLGGSPELAAALSSLPVLIMLVLIPVAVFRARRYRLSRTVWRGVRAGQTGSTWSYWVRAVGYGGLGWLTLGLLRPLAHARLNSFLMNHTWFGETRFEMHVRARDLMRRWLAFWAPLFVAFAGGGVIVATVWRRKAIDEGDLIDPDGPLVVFPTAWTEEPAYLLAAGAVFASLALFGFFAYLSYRLYMVRLFAAKTTFDGLRFASGIRFSRIVRVFVVLALVYAGLFLALGVLSALLGPVGGVLGFIAIGVLAGSLFAPFVTHPLLAHFVGTLEIAGAADLDAIAQNAATAPRTGEGLASVFDVDAM